MLKYFHVFLPYIAVSVQQLKSDGPKYGIHDLDYHGICLLPIPVKTIMLKFYMHKYFFLSVFRESISKVILKAVSLYFLI